MAKAAVVGLGTMGPGLAQTLARAGMEVTAFDVSEDQRKKAPEGIELANKVLTALGVPDRSKAPVKIAGSLKECLDGATMVVETVPEKLDIKAAHVQQYLQYLDNRRNTAIAQVSPSAVIHRYSVAFNGFSAGLNGQLSARDKALVKKAYPF